MGALLNADACVSQAENTAPPTDRESLRSFLNAFLKQCNIQYQGTKEPVANFEALCIAEASARGYLGGDDAVLRRALGVGATIAATSYSHLPDENIKMYIALFTGFVTYLDDMVLSHVDAIREFVARFVAREPQQLKALDDFAAVLLEMPQFFNSVACNIILTSALHFVTSLLIQYDVLGVPIPTSATEYPMFFRRMSGIGNAYAAFIFPASMPIHSWVVAVPDIADTICTVNDVLSFYKEDLDGEVEDTLIWLIARNRNIPVYESLRNVANETVGTHNRALRALQPSPDAYEAYQKFADGFHGFHVESKRYRLQELTL